MTYEQSLLFPNLNLESQIQVLGESRYLLPGKAIPIEPISGGKLGRHSVFGRWNDSLEYKWKQRGNGFLGGRIEFGIRDPEETYDFHKPNQATALMNITLNTPGSRSKNKTSEGLIAFLSGIATLEETARILQKDGIGLINLERATKSGERLMKPQVQLGNYKKITKKQAGYGIRFGLAGNRRIRSYYFSRFPKGDDSLKGFVLGEVVESLAELARKNLFRG